MEKILSAFVDEGGDTDDSGVLFGDETIEKYATGFLGFWFSIREFVSYDYVDTWNDFRFNFFVLMTL